VQSEPEKGTRFTFTLPLSEQETEIEVNEPPLVDSSAGRPLILVVDDEQPARELITGYLNPEGYSTVCVNSGIEAVNLARKLRPSCITLDILMPGGSGWETLHELHQHPDTRDIPIIVVSVIDQRRLGMALGASDYLVKPVQREELLSSLERYAVRSGTGVHCVVADDNPADLRLVADTLAEAGFSHELASNGREALAAMRARPTDVLLLDLTMPVMDGFEVLREMADDPALCDVPAVVLTGKNLSSEELQMLERSTRGIFQKDGEWRSRLLQSIRKVVRSRAAAQGSAS
jgi:CheY-like chemotaxis protein